MPCPACAKHGQALLDLWEPLLTQSVRDRHGQSADMYSLGITVLELATGRAPYSGLPFAVQAMHKLHNPPPTLAGLAPDSSFPPVWAPHALSQQQHQVLQQDILLMDLPWRLAC